GDLTYYDPGLGSCGITSGENDAICAVSHYTFDAAQKGSDPNQNPLCGRMIRAQRVNNGKTVSVDLKVVDRCTGCQPTDIDVSPGIFKQLADPDLGRVNVTWAWL
ncbi:RlpA-like double-psi beta-barrel-protein domain-containing protein-containing protein, partial [Lophiotrema nucula]